MTLHDYDAAVAEAAAHLDNLNQRILEGDASVTAADLSAARESAEFAAVQACAAEQRQKQAAVDKAVEETQQAAADLRAALDAHDADDDFVKKAAKSLEAALTAREQRYAKVRHAWRAYRLASQEAEDLGAVDVRDHCGVWIRGIGDRLDVLRGSATYSYDIDRLTDPSRPVRRLLEEVGLYLDSKAKIRSRRSRVDI